MKKIKTLLFMLTIMLIGFVGINNVHAAENYGLWVNGEEFTSEKTTIDCGEGTATFDNTTKTLTLNNATINVNQYGSDNDSAGIGILYNEYDTIYGSYGDVVYRDIKLVLNGINTIDLESSDDDAIQMESNLAIEGTGTLNINVHKGDGYSSRIIKVGNLTINDVTINLNSVGGLAYITADAEYVDDNLEFSHAEINNANISITNGGMSFNSADLYINDSTITISNAANDAWDNHGIFASEITIDGNTDINISGVEEGIDTDGDDDWNSLWINDGNITISANSVALSGGVVLDNYDKKIMASYETDGTNAEVLSNSDFDPYYSFVKMGDFPSYKITNKSTNESYVPSEAFASEPVLLVENWTDIYEIEKVQIFKTSDNSDITSIVGYNNKTHKFIMPSYPVTVKVTAKVVYDAVQKTISAKLDKYNAVKLSWTKYNTHSFTNYFDGCYIYYKKSTESTWKKITWTLKSYYIKTDLEPGVKYNFKVVPLLRFYGSDGKVRNIESTKYKLINIYTLKKMDIPTVTKYSNKQVRVRWAKVEGASGYQIARSVYKTKNYTTVKTVNSSYIGYRLDTKSNKTYYYKVRAYRLSDGKKIYGPWSNYKMFRLQ